MRRIDQPFDGARLTSRDVGVTVGLIKSCIVLTVGANLIHRHATKVPHASKLMLISAAAERLMCENVLLVYAHPYRNSRNNALRDAVCGVLAGNGISVCVSDLYALGFQAAAGPDDFGSRRVLSDDFRKSQRLAHEHAVFSPDIAAEQMKLEEADSVIFQFPMWFFGMPAILKGWFDRVMSKGFAYGQDMEYETGGMCGRLATIVMTTGAPAEDYTAGGKHGPLAELLYPMVRCQLPYVGFRVAEPEIIFGIEGLSDSAFSTQCHALAMRLVQTLSRSQLPK